LTDPPAVALARLAYENVEPASEVSSLVGLWHQNTITPELLSVLEDLLLTLIEGMREHVRSLLHYWDSFSIENRLAALVGVDDERLFVTCRDHLVRVQLLHASVGPFTAPALPAAVRRLDHRAASAVGTAGGSDNLEIPAAPNID
jgi:hypothetical protein